jgi:hypothetical protein
MKFFQVFRYRFLHQLIILFQSQIRDFGSSLTQDFDQTLFDHVHQSMAEFVAIFKSQSIFRRGFFLHFLAFLVDAATEAAICQADATQSYFFS